MPFLIRTFHPEHGHEYAYSDHDLSDRLAKGWTIKDKTRKETEEINQPIVIKKRGRPKLNGDN